MNDDRRQLEAAILGAILLENCYSLVGNFISHKNFSVAHHIQVMRTVETMWPLEPVDMVTVTVKAKKLYNLEGKAYSGFAKKVAALTMGVNNTVNVQHLSLSLVEMGIRETAISKLEIHLKQMNTAGDLAKEGLCASAITEAKNPFSSIFSTIDQLIPYFNGYQMTGIAEELGELREAVFKKVEKIKFAAQYNSLVRQLTITIKNKHLPIAERNKDAAIALLEMATDLATGNAIPNEVETLLKYKCI